MRPGRRRPSALRLVVLLGLLLVAIYVLWRLFIAVPRAPAPRVIQGGLFNYPAADGPMIVHTHPEAC